MGSSSNPIVMPDMPICVLAVTFARRKRFLFSTVPIFPLPRILLLQCEKNPQRMEPGIDRDLQEHFGNFLLGHTVGGERL